MIDEYLTPGGLSERYKAKLSTKALANMRSEGKGPPFIKIGRKILYPLADVRAWEAARLRLSSRPNPSAASNHAAPAASVRTQRVVYAR
jgi:hypothetical protein